MASTHEHKTNTANVKAMRRGLLAVTVASTKNAIMVGPNTASTSSAPPAQPAATCDIINASRKMGRITNWGAANVFADDSSQLKNANKSTTESMGRPVSPGT